MKSGKIHGWARCAAAAVALPAVLSPSAANADTVLEEIVVTAQKRPQAHDDLGLSITVLGRERIESLHITEFTGLANFTPGLQTSPGLGSGNPVFTIRGVGSTIIWSNNNPSVAVHVDDMYYSSSAYMSFPLFDVERIEVLKGPQGTLYGRNSTAGVINVVTASPSAEPHFSAQTEYGNYDSVEYRQTLGGELFDGLDGRLALYMRKGGGFQRRRGPADISEGYSPVPGTVPGIPLDGADTGYGDYDQLAYRASFAWRPNDRVDVDFSYHQGRDESQVPIDRLRNSDPLGFTPPADEDPYTVHTNRENLSDSTQRGGVIRAHWDLPAMTFSSVTGYEELDRRFHQEDGSPYRVTDAFFDEDMRSVTQELRLFSNRGDHNWMVGAFFSDDTIDFRKQIEIVDVLRTVIPTGFTEDSQSRALFVHQQWQFAPRWEATIGARYTEEEKDYRGGTVDLNPWGTSAGGAILPNDIDVQRRFDDSKATGKFGLDYALREDALLYASVSHGFKSGGFDGSTITSEAATLPYDSESLWAYEAGIKAKLLDNRVLTTASVFRYDYTDKQVQATADIGGGITEAVIQNAAESEATGIELELTWRLNDHWRYSLGGSYLNTEITDWTSASSQEATMRIGNELPNAPEWTANAAMDYRTLLTAGVQGFAHLNVSYTGEAFREVSNNPQLAAESVTLVGAEVGLEQNQGKWRLYLWCRNLTDEAYRTYSRRPLGAMVTDQYGAPRVFGIGGRVRFGD